MTGAERVLAYMAALDDGDFDMALGQFTEDAVYAVPAAPNAADEATSTCTTLHRGTHEIAAHFAARGRRPFRHVVHHVSAVDDRCVVLGSVHVRPDWSTLFMSTAAFAADGRIRSYVTVSTDLSPDDVEPLVL